MSDNETNTKKSNQNLIIGLIVAVVVLVLGGTVLVQQFATQMVDNSIQAFKDNMAAQGKTAEVTHDGVQISKLTLSPKAVVNNLHVELTTAESGRKVTIDVPGLVYTPKSFTMKTYTLEITGDVKALETEAGAIAGKELTFKFDTAPVVLVEAQGDGSRNYALTAPKKLTLISRSGELSKLSAPAAETPAEDAAEKEAITEALTDIETDRFGLEHDGSTDITWSQAADGTLMAQNLALKNLIFTAEDSQVATADGLSLITAHQKADGDLHHYETTFAFANLNLVPEEFSVFNPINLVSEIVYDGPVYTQGADTQPAGEMKWQLKQMAWETGLAKLYADGVVSYEQAAENLPWGTVTLRAVDLDKLFDFLTAQSEETNVYLVKAKATIQRLSGVEIVPGSPVTLKLAREKGGHLSIGNLSMEEAMATVIAIMMSSPEEIEEQAKKDAAKARDAAPMTPVPTTSDEVKGGNAAAPVAPATPPSDIIAPEANPTEPVIESDPSLTETPVSEEQKQEIIEEAAKKAKEEAPKDPVPQAPESTQPGEPAAIPEQGTAAPIPAPAP